MSDDSGKKGPSPRPLPGIPNMVRDDELAAALHMSTKTLHRRLKLHGHIRPLQGARCKLFTPADTAAVIEALRCPSTSSLQEPEKATDTTLSEVRSTDETLRSLRKRQTKSLLAGLRSSSSSSSSKIVSLHPAKK